MRLLNLTMLPADSIAPNLPPELGITVEDLAERSEEGAIAAVPGADLVLGDFQGKVPVTAAVAAAMDRCRLYHQPTTGYDWVDVDALAAVGIPVTNAGTVTSVAMAEHTVMVTLALLKSLVWCDDQVRAGAWPQHEVVGRSLVDLQGKTVGLVGLGGAGVEAARRFTPFGCRLLYTARRRRPGDVEADLGVTWRELDELVAESDVVCLLVDLNPVTRGLLSSERIASMKRGSFLVNASRGGLVDEAALVDALRSGHLRGAALDVFAAEPLPEGSPLRALDNVILTPHVGGATLETRLGMLARSWEVLTAAARGDMPDGVINGVGALRVP